MLLGPYRQKLARRISDMKSSSESVQFSVLFACIMMVALTSCKKEKEVTYKSTTGKQLEWFETNLPKHVIDLKRTSNNSAILTSDGQILGPKDAIKFNISEGTMFKNQPDHHAQTTYETLEVSADGVLIMYTSQFDHRSFGKNSISTDTGQILLTYTK